MFCRPAGIHCHAWHPEPPDPDLQADGTEVKQGTETEKSTPVVIFPSLVVNGQLVCVGRFLRKDEIIIWLEPCLAELKCDVQAAEDRLVEVKI